MRLSLPLSLLFLASVLSCDEDCAQSGATEPASKIRQATDAPPPTEGDVILFAFDEVRDSYGFSSASYGKAAGKSGLRNRNSQIQFLVNGKANRLKVSANGGEIGAIVDIGDPRDNGTRASVFWEIERHGDNVRVRKNAIFSREETVLASTPIPGSRRQSDAVDIHLGHIYIAAIGHVAVPGLGIPKGGTLYVSIRVVDYAPGRYVRIRWKQLL